MAQRRAISLKRKRALTVRRISKECRRGEREPRINTLDETTEDEEEPV